MKWHNLPASLNFCHWSDLFSSASFVLPVPPPTLPSISTSGWDQTCQCRYLWGLWQLWARTRKGVNKPLPMLTLWWRSEKPRKGTGRSKKGIKMLLLYHLSCSQFIQHDTACLGRWGNRSVMQPWNPELFLHAPKATGWSGSCPAPFGPKKLHSQTHRSSEPSRNSLALHRVHNDVVLHTQLKLLTFPVPLGRNLCPSCGKTAQRDKEEAVESNLDAF